MLTEILDFLRDIQAILGVIVGGLGGAWLQSRSATKALEHGADEARKQREHEEARRGREDRRNAHVECIAGLSELERTAPSSEKELDERTIRAETAVAVVRLVSGAQTAELATAAKTAAIESVWSDSVFGAFRWAGIKDKAVARNKARKALTAYVEAASQELGVEPVGRGTAVPAPPQTRE